VQRLHKAGVGQKETKIINELTIILRRYAFDANRLAFYN
jgi:hypothetical protein